MSALDNLIENISRRLPALGYWLNAGRNYAGQRPRLTRIIAGFILVYGLNKTLNLLAQNHWRLLKQGVPWQLEEETAVVTGGCSGFGLLITKGLAPKLHRVVVLDVSDLPEELGRISNVVYYKCDITSPDAVKEVAGKIQQSYGDATILINNAGIAASHTILDTKPEFLQKLFGVNVLSHWYLIQAFLPGMLKAKKGHVLALASMASYFSAASLVDYSATKHAVLALHDGELFTDTHGRPLLTNAAGLNQELKHRYSNGRCIQTSIVHPMWARTPLVDTWKSSLVKNKAPVLEPRQVADVVVKQILSGRAGQCYVPGKYSLASGVHGWPHWLREFANDGNQALTDTR